MAIPKIYRLQFYRQTPGDVGIPDVPVSSDQDFESIAKKALLGYLTNPNIVPHQRPHHAQVITHDDMTVVLTVLATGPNTVEKA